MIKLIKKIFQKFGVDLRRYNSESVWALQINTILKKFDIDLVLDVGANKGQYAEELFENGYSGKVVSFEPLTKAYHDLLNNSSNNKHFVFSR